MKDKNKELVQELRAVHKLLNLVFMKAENDPRSKAEQLEGKQRVLLMQKAIKKEKDLDKDSLKGY